MHSHSVHARPPAVPPTLPPSHVVVDVGNQQRAAVVGAGHASWQVAAKELGGSCLGSQGVHGLQAGSQRTYNEPSSSCAGEQDGAMGP